MRFVSSIFFLILVLAADADLAFAQDRLQMPYARPVFDVNTQPQPEKPFTCPSIPALGPADLIFTGVYDKNDPERDDVNVENQAAYRAQTADLSNFENKLIALSNTYYMAAPHTQAARARCALSWMDTWAQNNAMLGQTNYVGISIRHWTLASLASAFGQIRDEPTLDPEQYLRVSLWLQDVAWAVVADYDSIKNKRINNLSYWAAWSVTITGIATNNRYFYDWGIARAVNAIYSIAGNGTLPLELERGSKAMLYHQFALTPLLMLAEAGRKNGVNLYDLNDAKLHRLAKRVLIGLTSPVFFEDLTGAPQSGIDTLSSGHMAWLEVYNARFPTYQTKMLLQKHRPMISRRLGGNMTLLFSNAE
jgi:poly(beta-D-mannuronate) lyase